MRGMFTCGVTDVLMENGITFDGAVGVSAGATFGCNYKTGQIGRALRYNKTYAKDKRYCSFHNLIKTGDLFDTKFCYEDIPLRLDVFDREAFIANPMKFYLVATDVETGMPVYYKMSDCDSRDLTWMRASASMPMLSNVVEVDGYKLLDGGISDSIPIRFLEKKGYERNVVILTRPFGFVKKREFTTLAHFVLRKYPKMIEAMERRPEMYNETLEYIRKKELEGKLFVIRPPKSLKLSNLTRNPDELEAAYNEGRRIMTERLDELRRYL